MPQLTQKQSTGAVRRREQALSPQARTDPAPGGIEEVKPQGSVPSAPSRWEGGGRGAGGEDGKRNGKKEKGKVGMVRFSKLRIERR